MVWILLLLPAFWIVGFTRRGGERQTPLRPQPQVVHLQRRGRP